MMNYGLRSCKWKQFLMWASGSLAEKNIWEMKILASSNGTSIIWHFWVKYDTIWLYLQALQGHYLLGDFITNKERMNMMPECPIHIEGCTLVQPLKVQGTASLILYGRFYLLDHNVLHLLAFSSSLSGALDQNCWRLLHLKLPTCLGCPCPPAPAPLALPRTFPHSY